MKSLRTAAASALLAASLTACATAPSPPVVAAPVSAPATPVSTPRIASSPALAALGRPGAADAATRAEVVRLLGAPDIERADGAGALLTWRLDTCALVLGFSGDRLASVSPGPRRLGGNAPALDACVAEAQSRQPTS